MFASVYFHDFKDTLKLCGIFLITYILRGYTYISRITVCHDLLTSVLLSLIPEIPKP